MKLIATSIQSPLEDRAREMFEEEFSEGEEGLVVFPEASFEGIRNLLYPMYLARRYNIHIIGTKERDGIQQAIIVSEEQTQMAQIEYPDMVLLGSKISEQLPSTTTQERRGMLQYQLLDTVRTIPASTGEDLRTIIRICSDIGVPFLGDDKANLLVVPSSIQHPRYFFDEAIESLRRTLTLDARIVYSSLLTPSLIDEGLMEPGIYDLHGNQLGEQKREYVVFSEN